MNSSKAPILLPFDGSPASVHAARYVAREAREAGTEVHLLNVQRVELPDEALRHSARAMIEWHRDEGRRRLQRGREILAGQRVRHTFEVAIGREAETIARIAQERGCGLIVMGTRARHPLVNLVTDSVPTRVTRLATVPVLLLRHGPRKRWQAPPPRRAAVPYMAA